VHALRAELVTIYPHRSDEPRDLWRAFWAVIGARLTLGLPYYWAAGREHDRGNLVDYFVHRRTGSTPSARVRYHVGEHLGTSERGSLDQVLIERYRFHLRRGPSLWTVEVAHQPYPLQRAYVEAFEDQLIRAGKIHVPSNLPLVHFASGVDVRVFRTPRAAVEGPRVRCCHAVVVGSGPNGLSAVIRLAQADTRRRYWRRSNTIRVDPDCWGGHPKSEAHCSRNVERP
jgi:hypothetical protein